MRHGGLEMAREGVLRTVDMIMQFGACAQEEIVGCFKLFAFLVAEEFTLLQVRQ